jgi:hypothetical protein
MSKNKARKAKSTKQKKSLVPTISQADKLYDQIGHQMIAGNYEAAVADAERLLNYLPRSSSMRPDVLALLGSAHGMLQNYPQSYQAFTQALELVPTNAELWYNRGMASRFTSRFGRALRDLERASELNTISQLNKGINDQLKLNRKIVKESLKMRGPKFTLDQLIEQEDFFQQGLEHMEAGRWEEAEKAFRASIEMGDCVPQPWGNMGLCLIMQERYDEAEAAYKRALVIEPKYAIAKQNLAILPETRRNGPPKVFGISDPFRNSNIKQEITYLIE